MQPRLSTSSYIVLGLLCGAGEGTAYDLKQMIALSISNFWEVPRAQVYAETKRLAAAGLLEERAEEEGRRKRTYRPTQRGRDALDAWLAEPGGDNRELRDPGLLKLFLGADPQALAETEAAYHRAKLSEYEHLYTQVAEHSPAGPRLALECGIAHQREMVRFWNELR